MQAEKEADQAEKEQPEQVVRREAGVDGEPRRRGNGRAGEQTHAVDLGSDGDKASGGSRCTAPRYVPVLAPAPTSEAVQGPSPFGPAAGSLAASLPAVV
jgi:hypothetical protein